MSISNKDFKRNWDKFRNEVIEMDDYTCTKCGRNLSDNIILQVHHKNYFTGKLPWDYKYEDCETLCKGCHAEIHGIIPPTSGWAFLDFDDTGGLNENCEYCNNEIRYVYYIHHPRWEPLRVGTICCDNLTGSERASILRRNIDSRVRRLNSFLHSPRWKQVNRFLSINQKGYKILIAKYDNKCKLIINNKEGKLLYQNLNDAKTKIFELIDSQELKKYL